MEIEALCKKIRELKIQEKKIQKELEDLKNEFKNYAIDNQLEKGDYHGIKLMYRDSFDEKKNVELAKEKGIPVPVKKSVKLSDKRIEELIKDELLAKDEIIETVDTTKLKKIFEIEEIEGHYNRSLAIGISHE